MSSQEIRKDLITIIITQQINGGQLKNFDLTINSDYGLDEAAVKLLRKCIRNYNNKKL